jgi:hypothetical protein
VLNCAAAPLRPVATLNTMALTWKEDAHSELIDSHGLAATVNFVARADSDNRTYRYTKQWYVAKFIDGKLSLPGAQCDSEAAAKDQAEQWEADEPPWEECSICEYPQTLKAGQDGMLRFVEHSRDKSHKGKVITVPCEGSYRTPNEAAEIRNTMPPSDPSHRPLY